MALELQPAPAGFFLPTVWLYCDCGGAVNVGAESVTKLSTEVNLGGRPRLYKTPEEFEAKVHEFNEFCEAKNYPVTWTGLALYMGFSSRQSIDEYLKYDGFSDSVKKAKAFVEWHYEMRLCGDKPTGAIFALKNFGWKDKSEVEQTLTVTDGATLAERLTGGSKR